MAAKDPSAFFRYLSTFQDLAGSRLAQFRATSNVASSLFLGLIIFLGYDKDLLTLVGAVLITICALVPAWMWVTGRAKGLPIYPAYSATFLWAFALPLVTEHPIIVLFPPTFHFVAAISVCACLLAGTAGWWICVRHRIPAPRTAWMLPMSRGSTLFWLFLVAALGFNILSFSGILSAGAEGYSVLRAVILGIASLAAFFFGYQHGIGTLNSFEKFAYIGLVAASCIVSVTGMLLAYAGTTCLTTIIGFTLGRGVLPWRAIVGIAAIFSFFHAGKADQREQYWGEVMWQTVSVQDYPVFFADWIGHSVDGISESLAAKDASSQDETKKASAWERTSLMHLFLYFQYSTGSQVPYLWGLTYSVIPELLIPRIFYGEKAKAHFGNNVLAVHYGIVENSAETQTSVGFGFVNEAYANFGLVGAIVIHGLIGVMFGWCARVSMSVPLMSYRFLWSVIVLGGATQNEATMGVLVSSTFQATLAFSAVGFFFMSRFPLRRAYQLLSEAMSRINATTRAEIAARNSRSRSRTARQAREEALAR